MRSVEFAIEHWDYRAPFHITGHVFERSSVLLVTLQQDGFRGRGEASGIYYLDETPDRMLALAETVRAELEAGCSRQDLARLLPRGGARNAIDCALWDLEAKCSGQSVWASTGLACEDVFTVNTVGIDSPARMAERARELDTDRIKVKLDGEIPLERLRAVRDARPDAQLVVDANQGWTFGQLQDLAPRFRDLGVAMLEQPLPRGGDAELEGYEPPIPLCADESCLDVSELAAAAPRYQIINIKLDKTGGLTEALELARQARSRGLGLMVGNMMGTSLAMAPAFVIAQMCDFVDLDGPLFLREDRSPSLSFEGGRVTGFTPELWG